MQGRFSVLSKFGIKFVEVAGAGLASALCAFCLGQLGEQRTAPAPAAPVVQVVPASEDAMRMARDDHALLAALVRKQSEGHEGVETARPAPAAAAAKPAKPAPPAQARRSQKPEPATAAETPARAAEPMPIQPPAANTAAVLPAQSSRPPTAPDASAGVSAGEEEHPLLDRLAQIPAWFLPGNERVFGDAPRPPMPVGEFFPRAM